MGRSGYNLLGKSIFYPASVGRQQDRETQRKRTSISQLDSWCFIRRWRRPLNTYVIIYLYGYEEQQTDYVHKGGPRNVLPGALMFGIFGYGGQTLYNFLDNEHTSKLSPEAVHKPNMFQRFASLKWSPVSVLSDTEYEAMLREKVLKFDVEIALLDDRIAVLKKQAERLAKETTTE